MVGAAVEPGQFDSKAGCSVLVSLIIHQAILGSFTWWKLQGSPREARDGTSPDIFQVSPASHFILSHWPKQVMWPSPESVWEHITLEPGFRVENYCNHFSKFRV